jgi:molybdenum cofactor cytidylyltransferase
MERAMSGPYSSVVLDHFRRPLNRERLANANAAADGANPLCGDRIRMECEVSAGQVRQAAFTGDACAICIAAASVLSERVKGLTVRQAMAIDGTHLVSWLDGAPPQSRRRCATLPLDTLQRALMPFVQNARARPVILAAGAGTRFGGDKLTAVVDGEPMIRGIVRAYAALAGQVTVVARARSQFEAALQGLPATIVENTHADEGIASSIRAAVTSCSDRPAIMIALGDEPRVQRSVVARVLERWEKTAAPIVAPRYNGVSGHPVLFHRSCFADLLALDGDVGARGVIRHMTDFVQYVDVDEPAPHDIDTPNDLQTL